MNWLLHWLVQQGGSKAPLNVERPLHESAGAAYADLIAEQLAEERQRKQSLEQRGIMVITTSGVLVGFLFGLVAVFTKSNSYAIPHSATSWLAAAMVSFTVAAILGLAANFPMQYDEPTDDALKRLVLLEDGSLATTFWQSDAYLGALRVAQVRVKTLKGARTKNKWKARMLLMAQTGEVVAIILLAVALSYAIPQ